MLSHNHPAPNVGDAGDLALAPPHPIGVGVACVAPDDVPLLNMNWASRAEATTAIRLQQADQNTTLVTSAALSGGRRFVMLCPDKNCTVRVTVGGSSARKRQTAPWAVQRTATCLSHSTLCTAVDKSKTWVAVY